MSNLSEFKKKHWELHQDKGLSLDPEAYKFTNLGPFFESFKEEGKATSPDLSAYLDSSLPTFLFVDGELREAPTVSGIRVDLMTEAWSEMNSVLKEDTPLAHLHHGLLSQGVVISVEKNAQIETPIRVLNLITTGKLTAPTLLVRLSPLSKLTLIEENRGLFESYGLLCETYVELAQGAQLEHIQLDGGSSASLHHGSTWARVDRDASYRNLTFILSGMMARRNLTIDLLSPGANGESYELFLASGKEHADVNSVINHRCADTTSNQIAKGIIAQEAKGVFTGKIFIHPKAQRVVSGQINRNLLLSKKAQIHSQPQLEIFADDVKCSHGSTTGQLSEEELFYFETRGIPEERARTLLAFGFGLEVVLKIEDRQVRERLEIAVMSALREKFQLGGNS